MSFFIVQAAIAHMAAKQPRNSKLSMISPWNTLRMRTERARALIALANGAELYMVSGEAAKSAASLHAGFSTHA